MINKNVHESNKRDIRSSNDNFRISYTLHPLLQGPNISSGRVFPLRTASKSCLSEFTQRVMSGKLLQMKQFQNQLAEAQNHLIVAKEENRALTRLLKRYEVSLRRHEGENAGMPRLLRAHAEEIRTLRMTIHQLKTELKDIQSQLRGKEAEVVTLKDSLAKMRKLCEEKKVFVQEKADKKIEQLEQLAEEQSREVQLLSRRLLLETKNHHRVLRNEEMKHKETRQTLDEALAHIAKLEKEKIRGTRFESSKINSPSFHSCCNQVRKERNNENLEKPVNEVKLMPIDQRKLNQMARNGSMHSRPNFRPSKRQMTPSM